MNWIKENKFLTGFFAVLVVVGGALGYLVYSAMSHYGEVSDNYDRQSAELSRLRGQKPYPNEESLAKLKEEEKEHEAKVSELEKKLATMKITVPPIAPAQFQDKLKASVDEYVAKAKQAGMTLPEKFYLGFER
ncbi:MAG TPA: Amuc_1100 family pilus-like protein, partial [Chthoniobacteraceae bacterium]